MACNVLEEVSGFRIAKGPGGLLAATWDAYADPCHEIAAGASRFRIRSSSTPRPGLPPGDFPSDPAFTVVLDDGVPGQDAMPFDAGPGTRYLLVTPIGLDGGEGPSGSY
jgi:hypothetical protein